MRLLDSQDEQPKNGEEVEEISSNSVECNQRLEGSKNDVDRGKRKVEEQCSNGR